MFICANNEPKITPEEGHDDSELLLTFLEVGKTLEASHESLGQDAVFRCEDDCVIVQFKYSSVGRKINSGEIKAIIESLDNSAKEAKRRGNSVTACVLFTNRDFTNRGQNSAKQRWQQACERNTSYEYRQHLTNELGSLKDEFLNFGHEYGLSDDEIEKGIDTLIGRAFRQTGDLFLKKLDKNTLIECLVGEQTAQPITVQHVKKQTSQAMRAFANKIL